MKTKIVAHRGDTKEFPENTLPAFISAKNKGADSIELDIHYTKDKKLVVHHDYYLGNTDNGEGYIFEKDARYLKSLDCGSWFSPAYKGENQLPLLEEVFETLGKSVQYEIELKGFEKTFIGDFLRLIEKFDVIKSIEATSPLGNE